MGCYDGVPESIMLYKINIGNVWILSGDGDPTGTVTAPVGSLFIDKTNGNLYKISTSGWEQVN